jgi:hypothetical protein
VDEFRSAWRFEEHREFAAGGQVKGCLSFDSFSLGKQRK